MTTDTFIADFVGSVAKQGLLAVYKDQASPEAIANAMLAATLVVISFVGKSHLTEADLVKLTTATAEDYFQTFTRADSESFAKSIVVSNREEFRRAKAN